MCWNISQSDKATGRTKPRRQYLLHNAQLGSVLSQRRLYFWQAAQARGDRGIEESGIVDEAIQLPPLASSSGRLGRRLARTKGRITQSPSMVINSLKRA